MLTGQEICEACGTDVSQIELPKAACLTCLVRWARKLETTAGDKQKALQRYFSFNDRKAWITKCHSRAYVVGLALKGEATASRPAHEHTNMRSALAAVAEWLRDAKVSP